MCDGLIGIDIEAYDQYITECPYEDMYGDCTIKETRIFKYFPWLTTKFYPEDALCVKLENYIEENMERNNVLKKS